MRRPPLPWVRYSRPALSSRALSPDTPTWDAIDIGYLPSREAFQALLENEARQQVLFHRDAALAASSSLLASPNINSVPGAPNVSGNQPGGTPLLVTELGVGQVCLTDADCAGIGTCLSDGISAGFCTRQCGSGECGSPYTCCHSCAPTVAALLPFSESACLIESLASQLTAAPASCTCE